MDHHLADDNEAMSRAPMIEASMSFNIVDAMQSGPERLVTLPFWGWLVVVWAKA